MVLGEDKHSWGSQLLNNSERDSQHSVRGGALSGQLISLQSIGGGGTGRRQLYSRGREEECIKIA